MHRLSVVIPFYDDGKKNTNKAPKTMNNESSILSGFACKKPKFQLHFSEEHSQYPSHPTNQSVATRMAPVIQASHRAPPKRLAKNSLSACTHTNSMHASEL